MSDCCSRHSKHKEKESLDKTQAEVEPKSFVGKFLYRMGKSDYEKEKTKHEGCH